MKDEIRKFIEDGYMTARPHADSIATYADTLHRAKVVKVLKGQVRRLDIYLSELNGFNTATLDAYNEARLTGEKDAITRSINQLNKTIAEYEREV